MDTEPSLLLLTEQEQEKKTKALQKLLEEKLKVANETKSWPETIKVLSADNICRGFPMRMIEIVDWLADKDKDRPLKDLTAWAVDEFLYQKELKHASAFMAFRIAFQVVAIEVSGKDYQHMGPFGDDGKQTKAQIAEAFNKAAGLCGYEEGKR